MADGESEPAKAEVPAALIPYFAVADGLAALFRPFVEVVVHDLARDCVAYVANPLSPREPGDPSELEQITFMPEASVIGPYEKVNWDGRRIKSISIVLRDGANKPTGLLCVNADVTEFDAARRVLQSLLGGLQPTDQAPVHFHDDWHEKVNRFIAAWTAEQATTVERMDRSARRNLIEALYVHGGFEGPRAPAYVAQVLGISRATVYNELARLRAAGGPA
jgi:predicted transcriptional regulator YheO